MTNKIYIPNEENIQKAVKHIREGGVLGLPTETVYGLAADAKDADGVEKIYGLKNRDYNKPLQVMVANLAAAKEIAVLDDNALNLIYEFWPGPLTLVVKAIPNCGLSQRVIRNGTIGLRIPNHLAAIKLIRAVGTPLAVSSANISDEPPALSAAKVEKTFPSLEIILDGGPANIGVSSTVVDLSEGKIKILRRGSITESQLKI